MSQHPGKIVAESPVPAFDAVLSPMKAPLAIAAAQDAPAAAVKQGLRKLLLVGASVLAVAGAGYFGWDYWTVGRFQVSTDDAYVQRLIREELGYARPDEFVYRFYSNERSRD